MSHSGCQTQLAGIECDGRMISMARDPPGQRSVYIPPGDPHRETYRLSTYKDFPTDCQVDVRRLARNGFYFTGFKDRVKCFSCGQCVQDWTISDNPDDPGWHRHDCQHARGQDASNVPLLSIIQRFDQRRNVTPKPHSSHNGPTQRSSPPSAGEILTQGLDFMEETVQPNTSTYQTASVAQATRVPPPSVVAATRAAERNPPAHVTNSTLGEIERLRPTTNSLFPCSNSVNPHMRSEESRLQTFLDHSSSWPAHRIRATPRQIANAGMYYLGVRDRVKCWYCNGGLQNWERDDDPWEEHAKWFPLCEFTLQQRGPDFVHSMVSRFPNLRRPILRNPANPLQLRRSTENNTRGPEIIDPRNEARSLERKIDEEMSSSELVEQARLMGFDERIIRISLKRKYEATGNGFSRLETLVESILAMEEISASNRCEEGGSAFATNEATPSTSTRNLSTTSGLQEIRRLQEERLCKVCGNEQASVVLIPCGHIACCVGCAENASTCPICRLRVREKIRSFIV
ncbi:unnamed protein product [Clavelina lepadiformis]|uniref:RING-type domain-containing protein n=1 Tax=Clavelina lepadiformis TaxID=159417 RepID=A0ABP0G693_CLALP